MSIAKHVPKWTLTFSDEFEGPAGSAPSTACWTRDLGGWGFGNHELQSYTDGAGNAFLDGDGNLVIEARKEPTTGPDGISCDYSSARLLTRGLFTQQYGRIEVRLKLPEGQGIWPAFWMLSDNFAEIGWPDCGEIDIIESVGVLAKTAYGTLHGPGYSGANPCGGTCPAEASYADDFHIYALEWSAEGMSWFVDDHLYHSVTPASVAPNPWPFDQPFYIIMNLAVGGDWPGYPDETTQFPQRLTVDYVRVYRELGPESGIEML